MIERPMRLGLAGLGWWGRVLLGAGAAYQQSYRFDAAVCRDDDGFRTAQEFGLRAYPTYEEMIEDQHLDAVVLATPNSMHVSQIIAAAARGLHVYTEKPLSLEFDSAVVAVEACRQAGVVLGIGTDKRFLPAVAALESMVVDGILGPVAHVEGNYSNDFMSAGLSGHWRLTATEAPAAGLTGPGLHVLDVIVQMMGPAKSVSCRSIQHDSGTRSGDVVIAEINFVSGATGTVTAVRGTPEYFRITAFGADAWAEVSHFGLLRGEGNGEPPWWRAYSGDLQVGALLDRFACGLRIGKPFPVSTQAMLRTTAALEAAIASHASGGRPAPARQEIS
jgi:predicted dehydrogenase